MAPWTLQRLERAVESFSAQLQCAICLCAYDNPVSLPCNHCFCEECIHRALELKALCPICKTPAKKRRLRYDTTVQELLRATEMLCAAPASAPAVAEAQTPIKTEKETPKEMKKQVKVASMPKVAAVKTPERRASPRRVAKRNSQNSPSTQTLMDMWVTGGSNGVKIKKENTPVRRASPRRALTQEMNSQVTEAPMSSALFEIAAPRAKNDETKDSSRRPGTDAVAITTDTVDETVGRNQQTLSPRRPATIANTSGDQTQLEPKTLSPRRRADVDVVAETQLEVVELGQQTPTRRRSATDKTQVENVNGKTITPRRRRAPKVDVVHDETQEEPAPQEQYASARRTRVRSATNLVTMDATPDDSQLEAVEPKHQTPTPRKRRRSATNRIDTNAEKANESRIEPNHQPVTNGQLVVRNGTTETSSLAVDSQTEPLPEIVVFQVGDLVEVIERHWVGINKQGGAARITKVHGDGFYAVKFVIGGKDNRVPGFYIRTPAEDLVSDSTPSRAVRKRQRRRSSTNMVSPDLLAMTAIPSPDKKKVKTKPKSTTNRKHSGMVFLSSGFKEDDMQQIDEWAELLGAEVVQYWSNDVTHLIVKCVSGDDIEEDDPSMENSDSASSPQGQEGGKRKLFGGPKSGRWVKIRSLKYLKALVGGRWIVSDEWLQACTDHGGYVSEVDYEADGHWKGRRIHDAVRRSRLTREKLLQLSSSDADRSNVGTMLFADFCFHVIGEFLPPMPPITELNTLICMGGGKLIAFMDEIPDEMHKRENRSRKLIIVSDKINPIALRQQTRHLKAQPQMKAVSSAIIVNYLWVINSISEAKLRELP